MLEGVGQSDGQTVSEIPCARAFSFAFAVLCAGPVEGVRQMADNQNRDDNRSESA